MWAISVPILVFLGLSVLELGPMYTTDRRQTKASLNAPPIRGGHNNEAFSGQRHTWKNPKWVYGEQVRGIWYYFPLMLWHCWLGDSDGIQPVKSWVLTCWWWQFDCSFAYLIAPVVNTISIIHSSNKIQNWDILVLPNSRSPGKWLLKRCKRRDKRRWQP